MGLVYKDRVSQDCTAPATSSPFDFDVGGSTPTGYQSWDDALADAETAIYSASDSSGNWEVGVGTWTEADNALTRTTILASSNAGSAETFSGAVTVDLSSNAGMMTSMDTGAAPGGRLTLTTGAPVTTSDVTAATTIYYTPYVHNKITLWNGDFWETVVFSEVSQALGTLTSGKPYDVFAYLSSGALAIEILVWTDDTTRATAVTLQDGRYCKSGDKARLLLGTFYTASATTTEDSATKRYLGNMYNRVCKKSGVRSASSHSYTSGTERDWDNDTSSYVYFSNPDPSPGALVISVYYRIKYGTMRFRLNGTNLATQSIGLAGSSTEVRGGTSAVGWMQAGLNTIIAREVGATSATFYESESKVAIPC